MKLLDFGLQSGQIANQARIFALGNDICACVYTLYMFATFSGGAAGTFAWSLGGWHGVCSLAVVLVVIAGVVLALNLRTKANQSQSQGA